jgi:hypothetical protein
MHFVSMLIGQITTKHLMIQKRNIPRCRSTRLIKIKYFHSKYVSILRVFYKIHGKLFVIAYEYILTYLRSWALLEKLPIVQPLKKLPAFYGTRRFIAVFTEALHWSLSWARLIQSTPSYPLSLRSISILSNHLRLGLPSGLLPSGFPTNILYALVASPMRATCPAHLVFIDLIMLIRFGEE